MILKNNEYSNGMPDVSKNIEEYMLVKNIKYL